MRAYDKGLIETAGRMRPVPDSDLFGTVRITTSGAYHLRQLVKTFAYIDAIIVDTPILSEKYKKRIRDVSSIRDRLDRTDVFLQYLDEQWRQSGISADTYNWATISADLTQEMRHIRERIDS